jgi:fibronectin-binding autotransporter adhesin
MGDGKGNPIVINLGAGNLSISAQDSSPGTGGSIYLNDANISAAGGNITLNATGTVSAVNTIFNGALNGGGGSVSLAGLGTSSSAAADMNGVYLSSDTIEVAGGIQSSAGSGNGGNLTINGTAPLNVANGSAIGVNISNTSLNGQVSNGSIVITGQGGNAANGASTGVSIVNGTSLPAILVGAGQLDITGTAKDANGGFSDGVVIKGAFIQAEAYGYPTLISQPNIIITGKGGSSPNQQSEGVVLESSIGGTNTTITSQGGIALNGTGGSGSSVAGVDMEGGVTLQAPTGDQGLAASLSWLDLAITGQGGHATSATGNDEGVISAGSQAIGNQLQAADTVINGSGGAGSNSSGAGVLLANTSITNPYNILDVSITGKAGAATGYGNYGVQLAGGVNISDSMGSNIAGAGHNTINVTGTGSGGAAIESDSSWAPQGGASALNGINLAQGDVIFTGTNDTLNLSELGFVKQNDPYTVNVVLNSYGAIRQGADLTFYNAGGGALNVTLNANDK